MRLYMQVEGTGAPLELGWVGMGLVTHDAKLAKISLGWPWQVSNLREASKFEKGPFPPLGEGQGGGGRMAKPVLPATYNEYE
jgi:hypothetical protein